MKFVLYLVSALWIAMGCYGILYTTASRDAIQRMIEKTPKMLLAVVPALVGVLLFFSASSSSHAWVVRVIGLLAIAKGGVIFMNPNQLWDKLTAWYLGHLSDQVLRLYGIIVLILGTVMFSWVL